jgi:hypothetical protein
MNITTTSNISARALERVPTTVFLFLGVNRQDAHSMGMVGCGLQLDDLGDYAWRETTISLNLGLPQVCVFLKTRNIPFSTLPGKDGISRLPIADMLGYIKDFPLISSFLEVHRRNKFLRLGRRAFLDPWDLDSRDSFLLSMSEDDFSSSFVSDPRGPPLHSEIASRVGRHSPKQFRTVPGLPDPGQGSWILGNPPA